MAWKKQSQPRRQIPTRRRRAPTTPPASTRTRWFCSVVMEARAQELGRSLWRKNLLKRLKCWGKSSFPDDPWCWYMYQHWPIPNVGKSSVYGSSGIECWCFFFLRNQLQWNKNGDRIGFFCEHVSRGMTGIRWDLTVNRNDLLDGYGLWLKIRSNLLSFGNSPWDTMGWTAWKDGDGYAEQFVQDMILIFLGMYGSDPFLVGGLEHRLTIDHPYINHILTIKPMVNPVTIHWSSRNHPFRCRKMADRSSELAPSVVCWEFTWHATVEDTGDGVSCCFYWKGGGL